ncbi:hypothetical protein PAECIP112173_03222 [Paenibacillus sp. JJ-100]|nr:hypothetical protein PAECIP112173_03222 [Paenibacillus sp. JJ-100]
MLRDIAYQWKLIYSPVRWIVCLLFIVMVPFIFYAPTARDVLNISEIYMPLAGMIMMTDLMLIEVTCQASETVYMSKQHRGVPLAYRFIMITILLSCCLLISYVIIQGKSMDTSSFTFDFLKMYMIVMPGILLMGMLGMTFANLTSFTAAGYLPALLYWGYWMTNSTMNQDMPFHLFAFANNNNYILSKGLLLLTALFFLGINIYMVNQSPLRRMRINHLKKHIKRFKKKIM